MSLQKNLYLARIKIDLLRVLSEQILFPQRNFLHIFFRFQKAIKFLNTVNTRFKKDIKLQIHLRKLFFSNDQFLDSPHKLFLNQTTLHLRKKKWTFLN